MENNIYNSDMNTARAIQLPKLVIAHITTTGNFPYELYKTLTDGQVFALAEFFKEHQITA